MLTMPKSKSKPGFSADTSESANGGGEGCIAKVANSCIALHTTGREWQRAAERSERSEASEAREPAAG